MRLPGLSASKEYGDERDAGDPETIWTERNAEESGGRKDDPGIFAAGEGAGGRCSGTVTPIGWVDDRLWSYIGLEAVEPGDVIVQGGVSYRVRSSRAYWLGDAVHHWWALLEREREAAI